MESRECAHVWVEEYYGNRCSRCGLFFAYGCAPWDEDGLPGDDEQPDEDYPDFEDFDAEFPGCMRIL